MLTLRGVPGSWVHVGFAGPGGIPGAAAPHLLPEACFPLLLCPLNSRQEEELQGNRVRPDEPGWPLVVWGRRRPWEKRGVSPPQRLPLTPVLYSRDRARLEGNLGSHWTKKVEQVVSSWTAGGREETGPRQREKPGGSTAYGDLGVQRETGAGAGHSGQVRTHFSSCEALRKSSWRVLSMAGGWSGGWHETVVCVKAPWPGEQLPVCAWMCFGRWEVLLVPSGDQLRVGPPRGLAASPLQLSPLLLQNQPCFQSMHSWTSHMRPGQQRSRDP